MSRRRGHDGDGERGSVAAELAVALPAVFLALLLGIGSLVAATQQVMLQDAAADAARLLGRGEGEQAAAAVIARSVDGASFSQRRDGDLRCVTARVDVDFGRLIAIPLRASSCALDGGR